MSGGTQNAIHNNLWKLWRTPKDLRIFGVCYMHSMLIPLVELYCNSNLVAYSRTFSKSRRPRETHWSRFISKTSLHMVILVACYVVLGGKNAERLIIKNVSPFHSPFNTHFLVIMLNYTITLKVYIFIFRYVMYYLYLLTLSFRYINICITGLVRDWQIFLQIVLNQIPSVM